MDHASSSTGREQLKSRSSKLNHRDQNKFNLLEKMETEEANSTRKKKKEKETQSVIIISNNANKIGSPTLIQWNRRVIWVNYEELQHLWTSYNPKIVCLQETFLKESNTIKFKNYQLYNHFKKDGNRASSGVSILISNPHRHRTSSNRSQGNST